MNVESLKDKKSLPVVDMDAELRAFEEAERKRLGLDGSTEQWVEDMANLTFTKKEKEHITILVSGLTMAQDYFVEGGLKGVGYNVQMMDCPDVAALQFGKEFGNRGQCNPTYFTVGNLVKFLCTLRDKHGMSPEHIVKNYVFLTAGACGPCRFGMYVTEYRKALRDAGFDGFRVVLFQQTGGLSQATGEESGLEMTPKFFWAIVKALVAGDVLNALGYRIRPYEKNPGDTDRALEQCKKIVYTALENRTNIIAALRKCKPILAAVPVDRTVARPKVSIIGEFWAMTTEGDGNYQLQRFLESEGAEADIQLVTAWLLYTIWEARRDTLERRDLRGADTSYYGLGKAGPFDLAKKLGGVAAADKVVRGIFQTFAHAAGLYGYHLPDMFEIARISHEYYNNDLRGGEGHMEVGKLIMNVVHSKAHMTLSVKPFGCMPSAGVSDGVQSAITEKFPGTIFCPVETSGDGRVNFYSRVQMYLFKAKQAAAAELERACAEHGVSMDQVRAYLERHPRYAGALHKAPHAYAGNAADIVAEVAPFITKSRVQRAQEKLAGLVKRSGETARKSPHMVVAMFRNAVEAAPAVAARVKEDIAIYREVKRAKKTEAKPQRIDAAAE
ncbi:MAG TPA: 2-hydroxyglutaryl-CoA dehydratase [Polyangiaceae bacterium]|nr:2-hydroxyglutaryl-CoA dehydratase [Polyangiaceae bacterium]